MSKKVVVKSKKPKGCRLCKYRVSVPRKDGTGYKDRVPACCFGFKVNDEERPTVCTGLFTETDFYIRHPEEP